jgi:hypothetical protein
MRVAYRICGTGYGTAMHKVAYVTISEFLIVLPMILLSPDSRMASQIALGDAYIRYFGICRICFRELALNGELPGVRKASL